MLRNQAKLLRASPETDISAAQRRVKSPRPRLCGGEGTGEGDSAHSWMTNSRSAMFPETRGGRRDAFTLVEVLVVAFILLLLAGIALPAVRDALKDGKRSQGARQVVAFLNEARSRAIATGDSVGVVLVRFGEDSEYSRSFSNEMFLTNSVPPYSGETPGALAYLHHDLNLSNNEINAPPGSPSTINAAFFPASECPLLFLSAENLGASPSPIRRLDKLELQGGRTVTIRRMVQIPAGQNGLGLGDGTQVIFDSREPQLDERSAAAAQAAGITATRTFPSSLKTTTGQNGVRFRIHRQPMVSNAGSLSMLRGMAVDLNFSGIGKDGIQFSQFVSNPGASEAAGQVDIVFAPDGSVSHLQYGINVSGTVQSSREQPNGKIYLCVGETDGIQPQDVFSTDDRDPSNLMNLETVWVAIHPSTGFITASPAASVSQPTFASATPSASEIRNAVRATCRQSRAFAIQADSLSTY